jgi:hypothetical protein
MQSLIRLRKVWHGSFFNLSNLTSIFAGGGLALLGSLFGGNKGGEQQPYQQPNSNDMAASERAAADEAARKQRLEAQQRSGARANLLTDPELSQTFGSTPTARKNLLGNSGG